MTVELHSFLEMAELLVERHAHFEHELHRGLVTVLKQIKATAKSEIGHYQPAVGPFPEWPPLAEATLEGWGPFPGKEELGFAPPDNPLLRYGELRDSFELQAEGLEGVVGSTDPVMLFHEMGTEKMPARPVLGPAAFRNKLLIRTLLGAAAVSGFIGHERIHSALGYDFTS
jgi:hypothetical protein